MIASAGFINSKRRNATKAKTKIIAKYFLVRAGITLFYYGKCYRQRTLEQNHTTPLLLKYTYMVGVVTFWETFIGVDNPIYIGDIWANTIRPLGGTHLFYVDQQGIGTPSIDASIVSKTYSTFQEVLDDNPDATYVFLEAERSIPKGTDFTYLKDFVHPKEDVIYVFGKDSSDVFTENLPLEGNHVVSITTNDNLVLWSLITVGIVLYDRKVK